MSIGVSGTGGPSAPASPAGAMPKWSGGAGLALALEALLAGHGPIGA